MLAGERAEDRAAALAHPKLLPADRVRRAIEQPMPTGLRLRWRRGTFRARQRLAARMHQPLALLERLPGARGRVQCPLCGWEGLWFRPQVSGGRMRASMRCPRCSGGRRHRLFWLAWAAHRPATSELCLHMAPEKWLTPLIAAEVSPVVTMDIESRGVDLNADAERLPFRDGSVDTIICNDVLEHVEHDDRALAEIARVLSPGGTAFLHTPVVAAETVEYGFANMIDHGHRRAYGPDLARRIEAAGLDLTLYRVSDLDARQRRRYGLPVPDAVLIGRPVRP